MAGLLAFVAVLCWAVLAGSLLDVVGFDLAPNQDSFFNSRASRWARSSLELLVIFACAGVVLVRYRFPLIVLSSAAVAWYAVMDLLEGILGGGNTVTAILALLVGLVFVLVAAATRRRWRESERVLAARRRRPLGRRRAPLVLARARGGSGCSFSSSRLDTSRVARTLGRSSYAVLGALGLAGTATYFIEKWFSLGTLGAVLPGRAGGGRQVGPAARLSRRSVPSSSLLGITSSSATGCRRPGPTSPLRPVS